MRSSPRAVRENARIVPAFTVPYRCFPVKKLHHLFDSNRAWSERIHRQDPEFFSKLARQ
jgi:hypothetical protein